MHEPLACGMEYIIQTLIMQSMMQLSMECRDEQLDLLGCRCLLGQLHLTQPPAGESLLGQAGPAVLGPVQGCRMATPSPALSPASDTAPPVSRSALLIPTSSSAPDWRWHCSQDDSNERFKCRSDYCTAAAYSIHLIATETALAIQYSHT